MTKRNKEALGFFSLLFSRSDAFRSQACLTLTAIHPDGKHRTPSRHIPLNRPDDLQTVLTKLLEANRQGWGAYFAVGLRRKGLTRYRRGGRSDVIALPALFADIDRHSLETLAGLRGFSLKPSCIVDSGGGLHGYWWLDQPTTELERAGRILKALATELKSDSLTVAQSLRLPGSINTKPGRNNAPCYIADLADRTYTLNDFEQGLSIDDCASQNVKKPYTTLQTVHSVHRETRGRSARQLNPDAIQAVSDHLIAMGYVQRGDWLCGACLYPSRHKHDDSHHSFGFNMRSGYANCFRCGSILLKDVCAEMGIHSSDYGGFFS